LRLDIVITIPPPHLAGEKGTNFPARGLSRIDTNFPTRVRHRGQEWGRKWWVG
jgi:hypothetical protein